MSSKSKNAKGELFDEMVSSILPSYSMFTSTVGVNATVPESDRDQEDENYVPPPNYDSANTDYQYSIASSNTAARALSVVTPPTTVAASVSASVSASASASSSSQPPSVPTNELAPLDTVASTASFSSSNPLIVTDDYNWKETILDNVHRMPNMTFEDHVLPKSVEIKIYYTKDVGEVNKQPEMIDPSLFEYKQGDLLNGYVTIKNTSSKPINFEMFYLLFEGNFMVSNTKDVKDPIPVKIQRFLEMFDFYGSWNEAHINRLKTDCEDLFHGCVGDVIDPLDGSYLYFCPKRELVPKRTYKRFFSFRIPHKLLDCVCNEHNLSLHVELPPTIGLSRWELRHYPERAKSKLQDLSLYDSSVSYGVMARFIGRKSKWEREFGKFEPPRREEDAKLVNSTGDEYIILKERTNYIRVVAETNLHSELEKLMKKVENKLLFENLLARVAERIEHGKRMLKVLESSSNTPIFSQETDLLPLLTQTEINAAKCRQLYKPDVEHVRDIKSKINRDDNYEVVIPYVKRSLTGDKILGAIDMTTPKAEYHLDYIPPLKFRDGVKLLTASNVNHCWKLNVPISLTVTDSSKSKSFKPIMIKEISVELVVQTLRSAKKPIAVELNHDLMYNKATNNHRCFDDKDTFRENVVKPLQFQANELYQLSKKIGLDSFRIERQLVDDIKSICQLEEKAMKLTINDVKVNNKQFNSKDITWEVDPLQTTGSVKASTKLNLSLNLDTMKVKGCPMGGKNFKIYNVVNLVPNFQSCYMSRSYHLSITVMFSNNDCARVKVPVFIDKVDME